MRTDSGLADVDCGLAGLSRPAVEAGTAPWSGWDRARIEIAPCGRVDACGGGSLRCFSAIVDLGSRLTRGSTAAPIFQPRWRAAGSQGPHGDRPGRHPAHRSPIIATAPYGIDFGRGDRGAQGAGYSVADVGDVTGDRL